MSLIIGIFKLACQLHMTIQICKLGLQLRYVNSMVDCLYKQGVYTALHHFKDGRPEGNTSLLYLWEIFFTKIQFGKTYLNS